MHNSFPSLSIPSLYFIKDDCSMDHSCVKKGNGSEKREQSILQMANKPPASQDTVR
jgi:hypothetical protein